MDLKPLAGPAAGERADVFVARSLDVSRSFAQHLFAGGHVRLSGKPIKPGLKLRETDRLEVFVPPPQPLEAQPEAIPLDVVYEDPHLLVVDKPRGMVVHPGSGISSGTLVNALLHRYAGSLSAIGGVERPGIVHRLDRDTSGLILVARTDAAHQALSRQFARGQVRKGYLAVVRGVLRHDSCTVDQPIARHPTQRQRMAVVPGGRSATTCIEVLQRFPRHTYLRARPRTGRTHQIRVHLQWLGHPILGDAVYGKPSPLLAGQFLHAHQLTFTHPANGREMSFESPLPPALQAVLSILKDE